MWVWLLSATGAALAGGFLIWKGLGRGLPSQSTLPVVSTEPTVRNGIYGCYLLYSPAEGIKATIDIVFFHGLQIDRNRAPHAWSLTWMSKDKSSLWPRDWLAHVFPSARIWSVCYPANAVVAGSDGRTHWDTVAIQQLNMLLGRSVNIGGDDRKVILIGHSMGGLMIKQLIVEAHFLVTSDGGVTNDRAAAKKLLDNLRGVVFYATPHAGSFSAAWSKSVLINNFIVRGAIGGTPNEDLLQHLKVFDESMDLLQGRFKNIFGNDRRALCFGEQLRMKLGPFYELVVPQASAVLNATRDAVYVNEDHVGVCQPASRIDVAFSRLVDFIGEVTGQQAVQLQEIL